MVLARVFRRVFPDPRLFGIGSTPCFPLLFAFYLTTIWTISCFELPCSPHTSNEQHRWLAEGWSSCLRLGDGRSATPWSLSNGPHGRVQADTIYTISGEQNSMIFIGDYWRKRKLQVIWTRACRLCWYQRHLLHTSCFAMAHAMDFN